MLVIKKAMRVRFDRTFHRIRKIQIRPRLIDSETIELVDVGFLCRCTFAFTKGDQLNCCVSNSRLTFLWAHQAFIVTTFSQLCYPLLTSMIYQLMHDLHPALVSQRCTPSR